MPRLIAIGFLLLSWLPLLVGQTPPVRILPLGDSITLGLDGTPGAPFLGYGGYRGTLGSLLTSAGYNVDFVGTETFNGQNIPDPQHEGHSGWRLDMIDANIANWLASIPAPDVVLMHLGTNDFPHGRITLQNPAYTANAINRLDALILKIATLRPNARIIVTNLMERDDNQVGQPDFDALIQSEFNPFVRARVTAHAAAGRRVTFLDMRAACPLSDMPDRLHPNQAGYNKMANAWFSAIRKVISPLGQDRGAERDLNGDRTADLLFQNAAGQIIAWYVTGNGTVSSSAWISRASLGDWRIAGVADLNSDGKADLIFQNTRGQIFVWYMNGKGAASSGVWLYRGALGDWKIAGVADLNGDGTADLLLQNTAGQIIAWYVNGNGVISSSAWISGASLGDWRVAGAADLNRDGNADIVFQNTLGQIYAWYLNGRGAPFAGTWIYRGGLGDWKVSGVIDINGDANADILLQNGAGQIFVYYMNGLGSASSGAWIYRGLIDAWYLR